MSRYAVSGDYYRVETQSSNYINMLPGGVYDLGSSPHGYFLKKVNKFKVPEKIYGVAPRYTERIISTYNDRPGVNTGLLLAGEKGTGKTMLCKHIANTLVDQDVPVILIGFPASGDGFNSFLGSIDQRIMLIFDEFEKMYDHREQEPMLTLFDGTKSSDMLVALTVNNKFSINDKMINRPGRIYYKLDFTGLDPEAVREYATEVLKDPKKVNQVVAMATSFSPFTFDMMKSVVEEMNRYDEDAREALQFLNVRPKFGSKRTYDARLFYQGKEVKWYKMYKGLQLHDIISSDFWCNIHFDRNKRSPIPKEVYKQIEEELEINIRNKKEWLTVGINQDDLSDINIEENEVIFCTDVDELMVHLKQVEGVKQKNWITY